MNVLITGFEPFRKEKVNPSWEVCKRLLEEGVEKETRDKRKSEKESISIELLKFLRKQEIKIESTDLFNELHDIIEKKFF